jgi:hypothetical protein
LLVFWNTKNSNLTDYNAFYQKFKYVIFFSVVWAAKTAIFSEDSAIKIRPPGWFDSSRGGIGGAKFYKIAIWE